MRKLSHAARGVWVDALSYCGDATELTGFLTQQEALDRATGNKRLIEELTADQGFGPPWESVNGGYLIHDFELYVPKTSTDRVRKWREKKRSEGVSETAPKRFTTSLPLARVRRVPEPEPVPEVLKEPPFVVSPNGLTWPDVGTQRGGEIASLADSLPVVALKSAARKETA